MNIDLTAIIEAIISVVVSIIAYKLIPWIKTKTTNEQQALLKATIKTFVFAADQLYGAGEGPAKFDYVVKQLEERGFTADRAAIEAVVKENLVALHAEKPVTTVVDG